jgi:hypothetical protein
MQFVDLPENHGRPVLLHGHQTPAKGLIYDPATCEKLRELFFDSLGLGQSPVVTARRLGIPVVAVRKWTLKLAKMAKDLRVLEEVHPRGLRRRPVMTGITLVHTADSLQAVPGQTVTFTAWVMNDTKEPLHKIYLVPRSFTNAGLEMLDYAMQPSKAECFLGELLSGEASTRTFTYRVTENDVGQGGQLVSAMGVRASTLKGQELWDECDAEVIV